MRLDDVLADPRYGHNAPYHGMPEGHLPVRSYLAVPVITTDGEVVGGLFFGHPEPGMFSAEDERDGRGDRGAVGDRDRERAALPGAHAHRPDAAARAAAAAPARVDGLELAASYRAAGEGNEVGGDFYDVFPQADGSWALVVGDVCGKGPEAAAVTALARYTLRAHAVAGLRPSYQLARLNDALLRQRAPGFVTVALARLELTEAARASRWRSPGTRSRSSLAPAARPAPFGEIGTPLGIVERPELPEVAVELGRRRPAGVLHRRRERGGRAAAPAERARARRARGRARRRRAARRSSSTSSGPRSRSPTATPRDDIACLAFQVTPPRLVSERFPATLHAAHDVADALAPVSGELGERTAQDLRLLATELVANAVRHTGVAQRLGRGAAAARRRRRAPQRAGRRARLRGARAAGRRPEGPAAGGCTWSTSARCAGGTNVESATACGSNWSVSDAA